MVRSSCTTSRADETVSIASSTADACVSKEDFSASEQVGSADAVISAEIVMINVDEGDSLTAVTTKNHITQ